MPVTLVRNEVALAPSSGLCDGLDLDAQVDVRLEAIVLARAQAEVVAVEAAAGIGAAVSTPQRCGGRRQAAMMIFPTWSFPRD
jgi:hypothetical protein